MKIALATASHYPQLAPDDQVLHTILKRRGIDAVPVIWDTEARWQEFDAVVVRSIWDYHLKYDRFRQWLQTLDDAAIPVHNSTAVLRHNADKRYLLDLHERGVNITPTRFVARHSDTSLSAVLLEQRWSHAVVKPVVSSTGYETWFVTAPSTAEDQARFTRQLQQMDVLVQEFAPEVHDGEYSFVFIGGSYSHCILKRAAEDEFRVHIEHGGSVHSFAPAPSQIAWAESVIATLQDSWSYARVDAVSGSSGMKLMEFELLDPELFFTYHTAAAEDEFRVHIEHGGSVHSFAPAPSQIAWAESVIATLQDSWSYARVDAVSGSSGMKLMEFELLDPELFFTYHTAAADRFADVITAAS